MAVRGWLRHYRKPEPFVITGAQPSPAEQHAIRKRRYAVTMGVRTISVVLAAISYQILWLMLLFAVLGAVLPLIAVITASDRLPPKRFAPYRADCLPEGTVRRRSTGRVLDE